MRRLIRTQQTLLRTNTTMAETKTGEYFEYPQTPKWVREMDLFLAALPTPKGVSATSLKGVTLRVTCQQSQDYSKSWEFKIPKEFQVSPWGSMVTPWDLPPETKGKFRRFVEKAIASLGEEVLISAADAAGVNQTEYTVEQVEQLVMARIKELGLPAPTEFEVSGSGGQIKIEMFTRTGYRLFYLYRNNRTGGQPDSPWWDEDFRFHIKTQLPGVKKAWDELKQSQPKRYARAWHEAMNPKPKKKAWLKSGKPGPTPKGSRR